MDQQVRVDYYRCVQSQSFQSHGLASRYYRKRGFKSPMLSMPPSAKGGMTVAYVEIDGATYQAIARCHPTLDAFSYRIGRAISTGRLHKLLENCVAHGELSSEQVENVAW